MTAALSSISGLISGVDTSSLIDAIIAQERLPAVTMETKETAIKNQQTALATYGTLLGSLDSAATALQDGTAFGATTVSASALTGTRTLATASSTSAASTGSYALQVSQLAAAEKLAGTTQASATTALSLTGAFTINGRTVTVAATDSLGAIRDKINALNSGTTPTGVTASILSVSPTDNRLVLSSDATGSAGAALADTTGTLLQTLGFLDNTEAKRTAAILVGGADAHFTLDTIPLVRSSNTVSDAIAGVTLNLTAADNTATTTLTVSRDESAAAGAIQGFVTAYNNVVAFLKQQGTVDQTASTVPALYGDSLIRGLRGALPGQILQTVLGAPGDLATAASAGVSLGADGTLTFDSSKFANLFQTRFSDLQTLFGETRAASNANVSFVSSGTAGSSGTWGINITAAATAATLSTSGFSGTYNAGATPDTLTLTDKQSGKSVQVALTTGMTTSDIVSALQSAITGATMSISVSTSGNDIVVTQQNSGSFAGFTLAVAGTGDGASEAWAPTATVSGSDVQGTIGGYAATGSGTTLVGNSDTPAGGLTIHYAGNTTGDLGTITLDLGVGSGVKRLIDTYTASGSGLLDQHNASLTDQNTALVNRVANIDARLALRRAALTAQFSAMETAIAALKGQAASLLGSGTSSSSSSSSSSSNNLLGG